MTQRMNDQVIKDMREARKWGVRITLVSQAIDDVDKSIVETHKAAENQPLWERITPPVHWNAFDRYIIADRHLPDGTRQHMVKGHVEAGLVVDNAMVIGEDDVPDAKYSDHPSHLSA